MRVLLRAQFPRNTARAFRFGASFLIAPTLNAPLMPTIYLGCHICRTFTASMAYLRRGNSVVQLSAQEGRHRFVTATNARQSK
jgi:hypothetical protein